MKVVRLRKMAYGEDGPFWVEAVVDRQQRGLAITQDKWASDASRWSVTHVASGRCINKQPLELRHARWLFRECLKRRVAWTKPMRALLKSLSRGEKATLLLLRDTADSASARKS